MLEPFDQRDIHIRRIAALLIRAQKENPTVGKMTTEAINLLESALNEWSATCPGAGWEHHQTSALVSLSMTPAMNKLLAYAAVGIAAEQARQQQRDPATKLEL